MVIDHEHLLAPNFLQLVGSKGRAQPTRFAYDSQQRVVIYAIWVIQERTAAYLQKQEPLWLKPVRKKKNDGVTFMKKANVHVVFKKEQWAVEEEGASDNATNYGSRDEAIEEGTKLAKQNEVELLIHREDGSIGERNSYGNDPRDVPG